MAKGTASEPNVVTDLRKMLDDKDIDAVSIATPNHWHALAAIWAMQAGKDVYVEKPVSHNVFEGRQIVEAARKYNRIVPDRHAEPQLTRACARPIEFLRAGKLGKVYLAKGLCYKPRGVDRAQGRRAGARQGVDYDLWLGPAPEQPVQPQPVPLRLALDLGLRQRRPRQPGHPPDGHRPLGPGQGRAAQADRRQSAAGSATTTTARPRTPSSCAFDYGDCLLVRGPRPADQRRAGRARSATSSTAPRASWRSPATRTGTPYLGPKMEKGPAGNGGGDHFANFVKAVQSRDAKLAERRHRGRPPLQRLCHLGNIAYRLGRKLQINPSTESFVNDSEADAMLDPRVPRAVRRPHPGLSLRRSAGRGFSPPSGRPPR